MSKRIHRGWFILILITLSILAGLGLGRFSFAAILPFMKDGLALNYEETGYLASALFFGYLISVLVSGHFVLRFKAKKVIVFFLLLITVGMVIAAKSGIFYTALIGCFMMGAGTGGVYVPSLGLLGEWFANNSRGMAMGTAMAGSGVGIVFSGITVPFLITQAGSDGWRISWYILAVAVLLITIINFFFLKNHPGDVGLQPISKGKESILVQAQRQVNLEKNIYRNKTMWFLGAIYFFWGLSYLFYTTFLVDYLIFDVKFTNKLAGTFFAVGGVASIISGFIWGSLSDRIGRLLTLAIIYLSQSILLLSLSFSTSTAFIFTIIAFYGVTLFAIPPIINASVSDYVHPKQLTIGMGFITLFVGVGQFISPVFIGYLIEYSNSYFLAIIFSSVTALLGGLGCIKLMLNKKKQAEQTEVIKPVS